MERRGRKRRAAVRVPTSECLARVRALIEDHPCLVLSVDCRTVTFSVSGKKFWAFDSKTIAEFVGGVGYLRRMASKAVLPGHALGCCDDDVVHHEWVRVPAAVADRTLPIALALYNQLVLGAACNFDFGTLAAAAYRARRCLSAEAFEELRAQSQAANAAKHVGCSLQQCGPVGAILRRVRLAAAAPVTPVVTGARSRSATPPPVLRTGGRLGEGGQFDPVQPAEDVFGISCTAVVAGCGGCSEQLLVEKFENAFPGSEAEAVLAVRVHVDRGAALAVRRFNETMYVNTDVQVVMDVIMDVLEAWEPAMTSESQINELIRWSAVGLEAVLRGHPGSGLATAGAAILVGT